MRLAFSFGGGRLSQHRPGELPRLGHREACPPSAFAARALPEVDEDPRGRMAGITESEPADGEFAPAARAQMVVPSAGAGVCDWIWPHRVPPGAGRQALPRAPSGGVT
jgi:hypothetical protein